MATITVPIDDKTYEDIMRFPWVNWSEVARERIMKKEILERFMKTGKITDEDWEFCEKTDWHPVDELPVRKEFIEKIDAAKKEKTTKLKSVSEIFE